MAYNNVKVKVRQIVAQANTQTETLGIATNVPMGKWNANTQYKKLNTVRSHNATYQAKKDNSGIEPTITTGWQEIWQVVAYDGGTVAPDGNYQLMSVGQATNDSNGDNIAQSLQSIRENIQNESHFRGYLATNAEVQALRGTPNDYAYSAQSGTVWIYQTATGWTNSGKPVPDQTVPASNTLPLTDGVASAGTSNEYARGDHRHPVGRATQFQTPRLIDGVAFDGSANIIHYDICSTALTTAAKTVVITGFTLIMGARIIVNFTNANTATSPTLNVNNTGAKPIKADDDTTYVKWKAGDIMELIYDGTYWVVLSGYRLTGLPVSKRLPQFDGEPNPATLYGGVWDIDTDYTGKTLVGVGPNFILGRTGGSADAILLAHYHKVGYPAPTGGGYSIEQASYKNVFDCGAYTKVWGEFQTTGAEMDGGALPVTSGEGKNMPPYKVVAVWKRTA